MDLIQNPLTSAGFGSRPTYPEYTAVGSTRDMRNQKLCTPGGHGLFYLELDHALEISAGKGCPRYGFHPPACKGGGHTPLQHCFIL